jgi:hypothetical protein
MKKIPYIIILVLIGIIILMRSCDSDSVVGEDTVYTRTDTVYKEVHDTIVKKVNIENVRYVPFDRPDYTDIDTCNDKVSELLKKYNRETTYRDTIVLDSLGTITLVDTVFQNSLKKRSIFKDYRIPLVTKTTTIIKAQQQKRQLYIGGNLFGDRRNLQTITPGLLYKDRRDRVYQANVGIGFDGSISYGIGMYYKIKLK